MYTIYQIITRKSSGGHQGKQKEEKRNKKPKPEEQEGMPHPASALPSEICVQK
jgi:hypothetical protein